MSSTPNHGTDHGSQVAALFLGSAEPVAPAAVLKTFNFNHVVDVDEVSAVSAVGVAIDMEAATKEEALAKIAELFDSYGGDPVTAIVADAAGKQYELRIYLYGDGVTENPQHLAEKGTWD